MVLSNFDYQSKVEQWDKYSSIRSRPRRFIADEESIDSKYVFPKARQPMLVHPKLSHITEEQKQYILAQSLYKYLNDIANIEKDIINTVALKINKNAYFVEFPFDYQLDALSIIIDESYHAYVALDFMNQTEQFLGIKSLPLPKETELSIAIKKIGSELPEGIFENFELVAVSIAEHALTNDLIAIAKSKEVCKTFYYVMHDHVLDENRHAKFFENVLTVFWQNLPENHKDLIGGKLANLINSYQAPNLQKSFDKQILHSLNIARDDIEVILHDTHYGWDPKLINVQNIISRQMVDLLKRSKVFEYKTTLAAFAEYGVV